MYSSVCEQANTVDLVEDFPGTINSQMNSEQYGLLSKIIDNWCFGKVVPNYRRDMLF